MVTRISLILLGLCLWPALPTTGLAQRMWSVTRERPRPRPQTRRPRRRPSSRPAGPRVDRRDVLIARYFRVLEGDPREGFAFQRLMDLHRERDGNIDGLVQALRERLGRSQRPFAPQVLLGHVLRAQGHEAEARQAYERAAALRPTATAPILALAEMARSAADLPRARRFYEQALAHVRDGNDRRQLLQQVGELAVEQGDFDGARELFGRLVGGPRAGVFAQTAFARALTAKGHHGRAAAEYARVVRALRGDNRVLAPVLREMAQAQLDAGDAAGAIASLDRALRLSGRNAGVRAEIYDTLLEAHRRTDQLPALAARLARGRSSFETLELLGRVHDELGNEAEALRAYRAALRRNRRHIDTRVRIIQLLSRSGQIAEVIREYSGLIRAAPREPRFVVELAQLMMQAGRREEAIALAEQAGRRHRRDASVHQALAELYARWGDDERSARETALLVRIDPSDPAHLVALGAQQLEGGDRPAALATWRRILSVRGDRARTHATLGGVYADHDMLAEAAEQYREAVRLRAGSLDFARGLASVLERQRNHADAVAQWRRVLELAGDERAARREARQRIVGIWRRSGVLRTRVAAFRQAFAQEPPDMEAGRFLAEAYRRQGPLRVREAEQVLERIIELEPGDAESLLALERVRTARGDLPGAIDVLRLLVEADPRQATRYLQRMAQHSLALYRDDDAIRYASAAVERTPDDAEGHRRLGDLYRARQDLDRAVTSYRRALELNERLFLSYFVLAELYLARGQATEADLLYRRVMRASPDDDLVARAVRASMQIHLSAATLPELERDLLPLALGHPQRPVYRKLLVEMYEPLATRWIRQLEQAGSHPGPEAQRAAANLTRLGTRAIKPLLEALADGAPGQRRIAVRILAHSGNANAAAPLLAVAQGDGEIALREQALAAAGAVATAALAPRFVRLAQGTDRRLASLATWSLARMGGRQVLGSLRELCRHADPAVRAYAALGLGRARDRGSARLLARMLREDRSRDVRAASAWALGRVGDPSHVPALVAVLRGQSGAPGVAAAVALGQLGRASGQEALAQAMFSRDPSQRRAAARALRRLGSRPNPGSAFPVPEPGASLGAYVMALIDADAGATGGPVNLAALQPYLTAAAQDAFRGAVDLVDVALGVLSQPDLPIGFGDLTRDMASWPEAERDRARLVLTAMALDLLPDLARHPEPSVRAAAIQLLARMDDERAVVATVAALGDRAPVVQRAALEGLGEAHGGSEAVSQVAALLRTHRQWSVRTTAARALGRLGDPRGRPALHEALARDRYAFVREAAARALGRVGGADSLGPLRAAMEGDSEPQVRAAARQARQALER